MKVNENSTLCKDHQNCLLAFFSFFFIILFRFLVYLGLIFWSLDGSGTFFVFVFHTTVVIGGNFLLKIDWLEIDHLRFNFLPIKIGSENLGWSFRYAKNSRFERIIERDMFNGTHPLYPYPTVQKVGISFHFSWYTLLMLQLSF